MSRWGIRQESAKHAADREQRSAVVRAAFVRDQRVCQAKAKVASVRCSGPLDVHEIIPRSAWRGGYLVLDNVVVVCRAHHDWIGSEPDAAHAVGLHGYAHERPDNGRGI